MRAWDQIDTEGAQQFRQLANLLGERSRKPVFRGRGSRQDDADGHCKKDEQNTHIMSPFMDSGFTARSA
jgi:hypothetical protein